MSLTGTIIELLTTPNPDLDLRHQRTGAVTQSHTYEPLNDDNVLDWPDFTYENITAAYGHLFNIGPLRSNAIQDFDDSQGEIRKETHLDNVAWGWNSKICRLPMKRGAEIVQADLGVELCDITMQHLGVESKNPGSDARPLAPD